MHSQLVVLGGGPGGYAAAFLAADQGMTVALVEAEPRLGGVCLLRGCIPSKALLHVARVISESHEMADWGVEIGPPRIDLAKMRARKDRVLTTLSDGLAQLAKRRKVTVVRGRGFFEESQRLRIEGADPVKFPYKAITYDHCILATGSSPVVPSVLAGGGDRLWDSTAALELREIPPRLLVVGGGYIGLELGTVYAALGSKVTVVEMTEGLLPGVDRDLVKPLEKRLVREFEAIHLGTRVASLAASDGGVAATFEGRVSRADERFDRVLVAVGRRPNSKDIGLENTTVKIDDAGFVRTDDRRRTDDPAIVAIGDVAGQPMLAHKASHEGKTAVESLLGEGAAFRPLAIPAVVF
ncbi:MAG: FAD-dependent oxidoreductase, partial [Pirellulales bacterium]